MSTRPILRVSDSLQFRGCRVRWDFTSKIRMNMEYAPGIEPLDFGTAIHEFMEVWYDPKRWNDDREVVKAEGVARFMRHMLKWKKRMKDTDSFDEPRYEELVAMGTGMIDHYIMWSAERDKKWEPVYSEIEFELPLAVPEDYEFGLIDPRFGVNEDGYLTVDNEVAVYQGRIDAVMKFIETDRLWLWDHKTAASLPENIQFLENDGQGGCYFYAAHQLGIDVEGVIWNQLRKKAPQPPALKKDGTLSMNKSQNTTPELYMAKVRELGLPEAPYQEFLDERFVGQQYFRRPDTSRTVEELSMIGRELIDLMIEMYSNPRIYRTPGMFNCNSCIWYAPCQMRFEGGDYKWFLENSDRFTQRG